MLLWHCWGGAGKPTAHCSRALHGALHSASPFLLTMPSERRLSALVRAENRTPQHISICNFSPFLLGRSQPKTTHPTCNSSLTPYGAGGLCSRPPGSFCSHHPPPSPCHRASLPLQTAPCLVKQSLIIPMALQISRQMCPCINRCEGGSKGPCKHLPVPPSSRALRGGVLQEPLKCSVFSPAANRASLCQEGETETAELRVTQGVQPGWDPAHPNPAVHRDTLS